jgi:hypothetical protein
MNVAFWSRIVSAVNGAVNGWNADAMNPIDLGQWDTFTARQLRYSTNEAYYNNTVYDTLSSAAGQLKAKGKLYRDIRGVRNPVARLVNIYPAKTYGGSLDIETGTTGAIPLMCDDKLAQAIITLWKSSNWGISKSLYVKKGATLGDVFIKLVNEAEYQSICMELLDPVKVKEFEKDSRGEFTRVVIEYDVYEDTTDRNNHYTRKEIITKELFQFFKDDKPHSYTTNPKDFEYKNEYGFVPMQQAQHHNIGLDTGASAFHTSIAKIDEVNDAASILNDQIRKAVQTNWLMSGAKRSDVDLTQSNKDKGGIIFAGSDAKLSPMVFPLDITGALANITSMEEELIHDMPELALYQVRAVGLASGVAVKRMYDDAVARIKEVGAGYDDTLARAQAMGVAMGAYHKYEAYKGFNVAGYNKGDFYHVIKERDMFDESLDKQTKLMTLAQLKDQPPAVAKLMMREMGYQEDETNDVVEALEEKEEKDLEAAARGFGKSMFGDDDGETDKAGSAANARKDTSEAQESNRTTGNGASK